MNTTDAKRLGSGLLAGLLIGTAAMAGIYALAATAASSLAAGFIAPRESGHERIASISSAANRAVAERELARAKCKRFSGAKRDSCKAEAQALERRAVAAARAQP